MIEKTEHIVPEEMARAMDATLESMRVPNMIMLNGMMKTFSSLPPEVVALTMCKSLANIFGQFYRGDDDGVRKFRELLRTTFSTALHQAPVLPLVRPAPAPEEKPKEDPAPLPDQAA